MANKPFRDIGRGTCGSVFQIPDSTDAIKKGADEGAIRNDLDLTDAAHSSYINCSRLLDHKEHLVPRVPRVRDLKEPGEDEFWTENIARFPEGDQTRGTAFHIEHILPVADCTREEIVRNFYRRTEKTQRQVLDEPENKDCLVRLYLGKNNPNGGRRYGSRDSLRNFPLYLDNARKLCFKVEDHAQAMAMGLAVLHWHAQIDAQDTEFVLGCASTPTLATARPDQEHMQRLPLTQTDPFATRIERLWMLDFDKCSKVSFTFTDGHSPEDVVRKYLVAVTGNDPYFPHPRLDVALWQKFRQAYLEVSERVINTRQVDEHVAKMPEMLIKEWKKWGDEDVEANDFNPFE